MAFLGKGSKSLFHHLRGLENAVSSLSGVREKTPPTKGILPRDAMQKRGLWRCVVTTCLSVCHVHVFHRNEQTYPHIFSPSGSPAI